jgi:hypothetical protein
MRQITEIDQQKAAEVIKEVSAYRKAQKHEGKH